MKIKDSVVCNQIFVKINIEKWKKNLYMYFMDSFV